MHIAVVKETYPGERRVALVPGAIPSLSKIGLQVSVQLGAGSQAGFPDEDYADRGAVILESRDELLGEKRTSC